LGDAAGKTCSQLDVAQSHSHVSFAVAVVVGERPPNVTMRLRSVS